MARSRKARRTTASDEPMVDINTTPLIDVMLVLLIMLIITIPIQLHSVNLNMPSGTPPTSDTKPELLRIDIDPSGTVRCNGEAVPLGDPLEQRMQQAAAQTTQPEVHIRPDRKARYDIVAGVLASAQRIGLSKIGIVGSEQFVP